MPINSVIHTNSQSIDRVLHAGLPVMLVFWQRNSPQSEELDPVLNQLAEQYAGRALVAKVDAEAESDLVKRYSVSQLPTIVAINRQGTAETTLPGRVPARLVGEWISYLVTGGERPENGAYQRGAGQANQHTSNQNATNQQGATVAPQTITDANFDQIINSQMPVLVDFWAEWCGPCRMIAPSVETLAQEFAGRAIVGKLNVDHNPNTARRYNIMSIPALYIFKEGQIIDRIIGAHPLPTLRQHLARAVG